MRKNRRRRNSSKPSSTDRIGRLLKEVRATPFGSMPFNNPETIKRGIVSGMYTRERACEGKARFALYNHAQKALKDIEARGYADWKPMVIYPCVFCTGFHFATEISS